MGKVYGGVEEIPVPTFKSGESFEKYMERCDKYVEAVKVFARNNGRGDLAGEEISFPVADGAARYIVFSLRPVILIHLPVGDAYQFQYAERLTAADIKKEVNRQKTASDIFGTED